MSHENPETAKIFLNLEDAPESDAMSTDTDSFEHDQPAAPMRPQAMNTSSSSVASGPALVALIAILGGGSIFGMRVVSKHAAIAAENFVLDYQESAVGTDFDSRFEATMLNLERSTRPVQVPIAYLQRDPFNFSGGEVIQPVQVAQVEDPMDAAERERRRQEALAAALKAEHQRQDQAAMAKALGGYQLQSTLQGSNPVARISGEIVRVGGTLSYEIVRGNDTKPDTGTFTVEAIGGRNVILAAGDGSRYELAIGMPFRELEALPEEAPVEEAPAPVDEFAAAAAAAAAAAGEDAETPAQTPVESGDAETEAETDSDSETEAGAASEQVEEAGEGAEPTFMERLKAASEALKQNEAETESAAETEGTPEAESADPVSDEAADASAGDSSEDGETEAVDEAADASAGDASEDGETEAVDEAVDDSADDASDDGETEAVDETADDSAEEVADDESGEGTDDEGGR